MLYLLAALSFVGHLTLAVVAINRIHATALPYWFLKMCDALWYVFLSLVPLGWMWWMVMTPAPVPAWNMLPPLMLIYLFSTALVAVALVPGWIHRAVTRPVTPRVESNDTVRVDMVAQLGACPAGTLATRALSYLPGNQVYQLHVDEKHVRLPRLRTELDGLSIAHLSDLHFTGQLVADFYHEVVRQTNALDSDLIAITGDIIDKQRCLGWLTEILGKLRCRHGVYFVLGNHDIRVRDEETVRATLASVGHVDLGGCWLEREIRGCPVVFAGNELPWFAPAADLRQCPPAHRPDAPLRILLSHSPDQLPWARVHDFDVMLAGHTHGGQIRLPVLGPVVSPSRYGGKYASGTFFEPPTLLHVSRGISGTRQLRINCAPELTKLILRADDSVVS